MGICWPNLKTNSIQNHCSVDYGIFIMSISIIFYLWFRQTLSTIHTSNPTLTMNENKLRELSKVQTNIYASTWSMDVHIITFYIQININFHFRSPNNYYLSVYEWKTFSCKCPWCLSCADLWVVVEWSWRKYFNLE